MTSMPKPKSLGSNYTVKYDAWNRLSTVADGSTVIQTNRYDGLHRRVSRTSDASGTRHFYWNESWQCVEERVDASTTADRQYVWHPYYIDALAISYNSSGTAHTYVQDGNFNVTAAMDSSGTVVERYSYTPYGECIVLNADFTLDSSSGGDGLSDISNEFTYTGRRLDGETGLYQYRHRYYHAQLGRFVNRDPIGYEGSKWNLYSYCHSSPISMRDPTGLSTLSGCLKSPAMMAVCLQTGVIQVCNVTKKFCSSSKNGPAIVKQIEKWGGTIVSGGGKGSHTKIKTPWGTTEHIPIDPGKGLCHRIIKEMMEWVANQ